MLQDNQTKNFEGDLAFKLTPEMALYAKICTSTLRSEFYTPNTNDQLNSIKSAMRKLDPVLVAQMAVYAREKMYLRDIPLVLTTELTKLHKGDDLIRRLARRVISRVDELAKMLVYYAKANQRKDVKKFNRLSNQLRKGIADAFVKFDEYQFQKWDRTYIIDDNLRDTNGELIITNNNVKLRDVLFLTHPKPRTEEQRVLFEKIATENLQVADTWEKRMGRAAGTSTSKKEVWQGLIEEKRMGYQATMSNLRNFLKEGLSMEHIQMVAKHLSNPKAVRNSKMLPFRFLTAHRALGYEVGRKYGRSQWDTRSGGQTRMEESEERNVLAEALERAVEVSVENIPMFAHENVLVAADVSSSMEVPATGDVEEENRHRMGTMKREILVERFDIGILLGLLLATRCKNFTFGMFGDTWKPMRPMSRNILESVNDLHGREGEVGYSTNGYKVLEWALGNVDNYQYDRIMMFTDMQMWDTSGPRGMMEKLWREYKTRVPQARLYLFNLAPYDTTPVDLLAGDVYLISGWSDKVFDVLKRIEDGDEALAEIKEIQL